MIVREFAVASLLSFALAGCGRVPASTGSSTGNASAGIAEEASPSAVKRPAYTLPDTEVLDLPSKLLQREYQLFVALPESYASQPERRYPVLFVTDANYAFPLVRAIRARVGDHGEGLEDFILVGLSYAKGDTSSYSRRRDYTPTNYVPKNVTPDASGRPILHGQAEAYRRFIAEEVFPLVARTYRADMERKAFAGHSYGGLLGAHILFTEPRMFEHYILGSPSLWFDRGVMFKREQQYAAANRDLPASVYMGIGSYERPDPSPASADPRYGIEVDMVADMQRFERVLESRRYRGLRIDSEVIDGEDHMTVAPVIITRGLLQAFAPARDISAGG